MIVSRAGTDTDLGKDITKQLLVNPKALMTAAGILFVFGLVPGLPHIPFLLISASFGGLAYVIYKSPMEEPEEAKGVERPQEEPKLEGFIELDPLTLEIGYGLIPLVEEGRGELLSKVKAMRKQLAADIGFVVPPIHIKDNLQLRPSEYSVLIRGVEVVRGEVMMGYYLAVSTEGAERIEGIPTKEPAFGLAAYWIEARDMERAQTSGYMVVDTATVIATHLTELIRKHCWELLSRTEVQNLLDNVARVYPKMVDELIPVHMTVGGLQRVLQGLLKERVPINDLVTILETLLDYGPQTKDVEILTEYVRQSLSRYITRQYQAQDGSVPVFTLDPRFERVLAQSLESGGALEPDTVTRLVRGVEGAMGRDKVRGMQPVIVCSVHVRRFLKKIMEKFVPSVVVLSNSEISSSAKLYTMGMVRYED